MYTSNSSSTHADGEHIIEEALRNLCSQSLTLLKFRSFSSHPCIVSVFMDNIDPTCIQLSLYLVQDEDTRLFIFCPIFQRSFCGLMCIIKMREYKLAALYAALAIRFVVNNSSCCAFSAYN